MGVLSGLNAISPANKNMGVANKRKPWKWKWISPNWSSKQRNRTNYIKARIDKTQQNSKCRWSGERDETNNHVIYEYSKLAQKEYKTRHDWMGKVIHWEMCKKFRFDYTNKWYMHNPLWVLENETHEFLWDFNIKAYQVISTRRPDLIIINKKNLAKLWTLLTRLTTG